MTVHIFGAVSTPTACSFALKRLEENAPIHLQKDTSRLRSDCFVDNLFLSFDEVDEGGSTSQKLR